MRESCIEMGESCTGTPAACTGTHEGKFGLALFPEYAGAVSKPSTKGIDIGEHGISIVIGPYHGEFTPIA